MGVLQRNKKVPTTDDSVPTDPVKTTPTNEINTSIINILFYLHVRVHIFQSLKKWKAINVHVFCKH